MSRIARWAIPLSVAAFLAACGGGPSPCPTLCAGVCTNLDNDQKNCGKCGLACEPDQTCSGGLCVQACPSDMVACEGKCIDPFTDPNHCGASGNCIGVYTGIKCDAGKSCVSKLCTCPTATPNACGAGTTAFCTDFKTDPANCGACGNKCAAGKLCVNGTCGQTCSTGQTACPVAAPTYCADL